MRVSKTCAGAGSWTSLLCVPALPRTEFVVEPPCFDSILRGKSRCACEGRGAERASAELNRGQGWKILTFRVFAVLELAVSIVLEACLHRKPLFAQSGWCCSLSLLLGLSDLYFSLVGGGLFPF